MIDEDDYDKFPHIKALVNRVGDDSPWYEKALWVLLGNRIHQSACPERLLASVEHILEDHAESDISI